MAGQLIRELKLRGLVERVLIVCPANLGFQWQRELREKFDEQFEVLRGGVLREQFGINLGLERARVITSLGAPAAVPDTDRNPGSSQPRLPTTITARACGRLSPISTSVPPTTRLR